MPRRPRFILPGVAHHVTQRGNNREASAEGESIRRATHTGEPLGSGEFVAALENRAGRRLRVLARGRPQRKSEGEEGSGWHGDWLAGRS